jgi:hypothetical protein
MPLRSTSPLINPVSFSKTDWIGPAVNLFTKEEEAPDEDE